jgi:hypothetical protein
VTVQHHYDDPVERFHAELAEAPAPAKWYLIVLLTLAGTGCAFATWMLFDAGTGWIAKATALLLTEPIGVACIVALLTMAAPESLAARFFGGAMRRAAIVARVVIFAFIATLIVDGIALIWFYFNT